jgi:catechol 2,3-dioxygenase-like lactoylglutathione lyase family enzyme
LTIDKISSIILAVHDLERARAFYQDVLEMEVRIAIPGVFVFLNAGSVQLELRENESSPEPGETEVVFEVPDIYAAYKELSDKGVNFSQPPRAVASND